ncbi:MAG: MBL fold metallo-hydrolase [Acidimicrobiales bacterium]
MALDDTLYVRQLLSGRDFAVGDAVAQQMVNFAYLIGDRARREALLVDPAYRVSELLELAGADGMRVVGALVTHHHPDHVGGSLLGHPIEGIAELRALSSMPVHVHREEAALVAQMTGAGADDIVAHDSGERVQVGDVEVQLLHTPGHTPGSQCFLVGSLLVSGDTLFLEGCGRTDLPGGDPEAMYHSLARLAALPDDTAVFPGHRYSVPPVANLGSIKAVNMVFKPPTAEAWLQTFGGR